MKLKEMARTRGKGDMAARRGDVLNGCEEPRASIGSAGDEFPTECLPAPASAIRPTKGGRDASTLSRVTSPRRSSCGIKHSIYRS